TPVMCEIDDPLLVPQVAQLVTGDIIRRRQDVQADQVATTVDGVATTDEEAKEDGRHKFFKLMDECWKPMVGCWEWMVKRLVEYWNRTVVAYWNRTVIAYWKKMVEYFTQKVNSCKKRADNLIKVLIQRVEPLKDYEWQKEIERTEISIYKLYLLLDAHDDVLDNRGKKIRDGIVAELKRWFEMDEVVNNERLEVYAKEIISERGPNGETILHYALMK
ncbi:hypothetical protein HDU76_010401, partial [Blyttiomyces sp. JEL0837]